MVSFRSDFHGNPVAQFETGGKGMGAGFLQGLADAVGRADFIRMDKGNKFHSRIGGKTCSMQELPSSQLQVIPVKTIGRWIRVAGNADRSEGNCNQGRGGLWRDPVGNSADGREESGFGEADVLGPRPGENEFGLHGLRRTFGMDRDQDIPQSNPVFVVPCLAFGNSQSGQSAGNPACGGSGRGSTERGHDRPRGNEGPDSGHCQSPDPHDPTKGAANRGPCTGANTTSGQAVQIIPKVVVFPPVLFNIGIQYRDIPVGDGVEFQLIHNQLCEVAAVRDAKYGLFEHSD